MTMIDEREQRLLSGADLVQGLTRSGQLDTLTDRLWRDQPHRGWRVHSGAGQGRP